MTEDKHEKFRRLATARVNTCLNQIRLIKNLANSKNYEWTPDEVKKIVSALKVGVDSVEKAFKGSSGVKKPFEL